MREESLIRALADYGFGLMLTPDGIAIIQPTPGELPPDELIDLCRENRESLIIHLKYRGSQCPVCRAWWYARPTQADAETLCGVGPAKAYRDINGVKHEGQRGCPYRSPT